MAKSLMIICIENDVVFAGRIDEVQIGMMKTIGFIDHL